MTLCRRGTRSCCVCTKVCTPAHAHAVDASPHNHRHHFIHALVARRVCAFVAFTDYCAFFLARGDAFARIESRAEPIVLPTFERYCRELGLQVIPRALSAHLYSAVIPRHP